MDLNGHVLQLRIAASLAGLDPIEVVLPTEGFFVSPDGLRLRYLDWGGTGPAVVFLHGGALTAHTWDLVCLRLRTGFRCVALDQRGHGDSDWSPDARYMPLEHAADVAALRAHLGVARIALVGQSMGGVNALAYALRADAEVAGLVMVDIAPDHNPADADLLLHRTRQSSDEGDLEDMLRMASALNRWQLPTLRERTLTANLRLRSDGRWAFKCDDRHLSASVINETRRCMVTLISAASQLTCPVLVIRGGDSQILTQSDARRFVAELKHARYAEIPGAGHNVQGDKPEELAALVQSFLQEGQGTVIQSLDP